MIVHYHEAMALTHSGNPPGQEVTLQDRHQTAWRLFTGEAHYPGQVRDFIFRTDRLSDTQEVYRIRSSTPFENAKEKTIDLSEGQRYLMEWVMVPLISVKHRADDKRSKRQQAPRLQWEQVALATIQRHGFALADENSAKVRQHSHLQHFPQKKHRFDLLRCQAELIVTDPMKASQAWLCGAAKMRAYGMGYLSLVSTAN